MLRSLVAIPILAVSALAQAHETLDTAEVTIQVNEGPHKTAGPMNTVEAVDRTGITIAQAPTDESGRANFHLLPGCYRFRVAGNPGSTQGGPCMEVAASRGGLRETIYIAENAPPKSSTATMVSAASLFVPDKATREFKRGNDALKESNLDSAEKHFRRALEIHSQYPAAWNGLGVVNMRKGEREQGKNNFINALTADPNYVPAKLNVSRVAMNDRRFDDAAQLLEQAATIDPQNSEVWTLLTALRFQQGEYEAALVSAARAHQAGHTGDASSHFMAAAVLEKQKRYQEAAVELRAYLKEDPQGRQADSARRALGKHDRLAKQ